MSQEALQAIVGTAIIDREFCDTLLNGSRKKAVANFDLTGEELMAVMAIEADSLEQFADQLHRWILCTQKGREQPHFTPPSPRARLY